MDVNCYQARYYHLYSDYKTVKQISFKEWQKIARQEMLKKVGARLIIKVDDTEIYFRKGNAHIWIPIVQLKQILEDAADE